MNARYYDSTLNRFLSADTIVPNPSNPQSYNRYSYGYNNPIMFSDPDGHNPCASIGLLNNIMCSLYTRVMEVTDALNQPVLTTNIVDGTPPVKEQTPVNKVVGGTLSAASTAFGAIELGVSYVGLTTEGASFAGGPLAVLGVSIPADLIETVIGWVTLGTSTVGDMKQGGTYIDDETGHIILGQGPTLNLIDQGIDISCGGPAGPYCDVATNTAVFSSDILALLEAAGLEGLERAQIGLELHFDPLNEDSLIGYVNIYVPEEEKE